MQYLCSLTTLPHVSFMNYFSPKGEWMHFRRRNVEYIMYFIAEGEMYIQEDGTEYVLLPGDVFFLQPYLEHVGTRPAKCAYYFAHFSNLSLLPFDYGEGTALEITDHQIAEDTVDSVFDFEHCMLPKHIRVRDEAMRAQIAALFEECISFSEIFSDFSYQGVPDIRIIVFQGYPVMAMMRLATKRSDGRANLHQGAVGVGLSIRSGEPRQAVLLDEPVTHHPDTGRALSELAVPEWGKHLELAARCAKMIRLGYFGADIVNDSEKGPLLLELNARPGLGIQIANRAGLRSRLELIESLPPNAMLSVREKIEFAQAHFD